VHDVFDAVLGLASEAIVHGVDETAVAQLNPDAIRMQRPIRCSLPKTHDAHPSV